MKTFIGYVVKSSRNLGLNSIQQKKLEEINSELEKKFDAYLNGCISEQLFNDFVNECFKVADEYKIRRSYNRREDGRSHGKFYKDIYYRTLREHLSIEKYFVNILRTKGFFVDLERVGEERLGYPTIYALADPDYNIFISNNSNINIKFPIDSKKTRWDDVLAIKKENLRAYEKYKVSVFIKTPDYSFFLSRNLIKQMNSFKGIKKLDPTGKKFLFGQYGKKCVEISNRKLAEMKLSKLLEIGAIEKWESKIKNPTWTGVLRSLNGK